MRLGNAALIRIFTRTLTFLGQWVLRSLPGRPASLSHGVPCKLFTKSARVCAVSETRFTVLVVYTPVSVANRCSSDSVVLPSHTPRTKSRVCSTLPDPVSNLSTGGHGHTEQSCLRELHHLSLVRFPETILQRRLLVAFHVISFKQPSSVSHQPRPDVHGGCHFYRERRVSNSRRKHRI